MVTQYSIRFLPSDRQVITVQAAWKNVPCVMRVLRGIPANISEARISPESSTFYLDRPAGDLAEQLQVFTKLEAFYNPNLFAAGGGGGGGSEDLPRPGSARRRGGSWLSAGTYFNTYNRRGAPYTTVEVMTENRDGLLHDILMMLLEEPIDADIIAANTSLLWDGHAYVILQLAHRGRALADADLVHIDRSLSQAIALPAI